MLHRIRWTCDTGCACGNLALLLGLCNWLIEYTDGGRLIFFLLPDMPHLLLLRQYVVNTLSDGGIPGHLHSVYYTLPPRLDIDDELFEVQIH